jgi:hypothetical protein
MKKETRKRRRRLKGHKVCIFNNPRPGQLYQSPIAGFSARFRPPIKRYASGEKAMFTARLLCYPLRCCTRTGLQLIEAPRGGTTMHRSSHVLDDERLLTEKSTSQLKVHDAPILTLRKAM